jgi:hypothetical protein
MAGSRYLELRWPGTCVGCGAALGAGTQAWWDAEARTVLCIACCVRAQEPQRERPESRAGSSARREYDRRKARYERSVREQHPIVGGARLKLRDEPQSVQAWSRGAEGEVRLGERLDRLASDEIHVLHDRRIPGTRANIDHLVVAPSGVYVVDAKRYRGAIRSRNVGSAFQPDVRLDVNDRDRTKLVISIGRQTEQVRRVLPGATPILPVLCFVLSDWGLLQWPFTVDGILVTWPRNLAKRIRPTGPLLGETDLLAARLRDALPPA